jgi:hypothetical protein
MNEKVIEEIANQLGIAVDQASQSLEQIIPQYVGLQTMYCGIWSVAALILVVLSAIALKIAFKKYKENKDTYDEDTYIWATISFSALGAVATAFLIYASSNFLGWLLFPDAKVMDMVLSAIG